jgi:hypothetical protein
LKIIYSDFDVVLYIGFSFMVRKKTLKGELVEFRNGHTSFVIKNVDCGFVTTLREVLVSLEDVYSVNEPTLWVSEVTGEFNYSRLTMGYGWETSFGAYVLAFDDTGDSAIHDISRLLNSYFKEANIRG